MRKKYIETSPEEEVVPLLSDREQRALARMVRDYGVAEIVAAAKAAPPPRRRGRPLRPRSYYERLHEADWIEEEMEEKRQRGSRAPLQEALLSLYEYKGGEEAKRETSRNFSAQQSDDLNRADESYGNCVKRCSSTRKREK
jgi:hypothetical protein